MYTNINITNTEIIATIANNTPAVRPVDVAKRNRHGQFTEGYPGHALARIEHRNKVQAHIDNDPDHLAWLAGHGLAHIAPSEFFAGV